MDIFALTISCLCSTCDIISVIYLATDTYICARSIIGGGPITGVIPFSHSLSFSCCCSSAIVFSLSIRITSRDQAVTDRIQDFDSLTVHSLLHRITDRQRNRKRELITRLDARNSAKIERREGNQ